MATGQTVGYVRAGSMDENLARQFDGVKVDKVFEEKAIGKEAKRPALMALQAFVREGDTVMVHSIDRLARGLVDLRTIVSDLNDKGVSITFVKENLTFSADTSSPMNALMLSMMDSFADFERAMVMERQREGIVAAKAADRASRPPGQLNPADVEAIKARCAAGESMAAVAAEYALSRGALYAALKG